MFGFPQSASEWTQKDYSRSFTFIMAYIFLRPISQKFYEKLGDRQRKRDAKKTEDELIRKHKQQRVREQLGIKTPEEEALNAANSGAAPEVVKNTLRKGRRTARSRRAQANEEASTAKKQESTVDHDDDMPSDDDVSDSIG